MSIEKSVSRFALSAVLLLAGCATVGQTLGGRSTARGAAGALADAQAANDNTRAVLERSSQAGRTQVRGQVPEVDAQNQRFTSPLVRVLNSGSFVADENKWPNVGREHLVVATDPGSQNWAKMLRCQYRGGGIRGSVENRGATFWDGVRPPLPSSDSSVFKRGGSIADNVTADIALTICPRTWGDALTLIWGPNAWNDLRNTPEAKRAVAHAAEVEAADQASREAFWNSLSDWERCIRSNFGTSAGDYYKAKEAGKPALYLSLVKAKCGEG